MKQYIADAEFDSLTPTRLWCLATKEVETGAENVYRYDEDKDWTSLRAFLRESPCLIFHNGISFDLPSLHDLGIDNGLGRSYPDTIDTLVLSRLVNQPRPGGHSVANLGKPYGMEKETVVEYDRPELIDLYVTRCVSDIRIQHKVYTKEFKRFVDDPEWQDAIQLEHDLACICTDITRNGFGFNVDAANTILDELTTKLDKLTQEIIKSVGPIRELDRTINLRRKKDGTPNATTERYLAELETDTCFFDRTSVDVFRNGHGGDLLGLEVHKDRDFNPGSTKDRINLLNESGWKPVEKTKTHIQAETEARRARGKLSSEKKERLERLRVTGWRTSEVNLNTLPEDAPEGSRKLAEWLTLEARRADLVEWLGHYRASTGSVHSRLTHIGAWTHRCAHADPNCANIFSVFHGEPKTAVEVVKDQYDGLLRSLWTARGSRWLVGTDADAIQLRILAHLMEDEEYINAVAHGRKEDESDVHNVNKRALLLPHLTRDHAKTFIYAWLLGAGLLKVSQILSCSQKDARTAVDSFIERYPGLRKLKRERIPTEARRGFFEGLDKRKVVCDSEHLMLAGHLQNGEKIIMARANVLWRERLRDERVWFNQVNFVHDEWQTEAKTREEAEYIGEVQRWSLEQAGKDLNLLIPLAGSTNIGKNWMETH